MQTSIRHALLVTIAFCLVCATGCHRHSELSGTWVVQLPDQEEGIDAHDAMLPKWTLTLYDDGTFTQYLENHVMVTAIMHSSGKYTRSGDTLTLNGTSEAYTDDGYRKGTHKDPLTMRLKYSGGALIMSDDQTGDVVFRREGSHAPPKPKPQPRASDPKAVQIVHEMQRRYASLNTYSDEGKMTSSGAGFMAKSARFQTRFLRPRKFRFQAIEMLNGKEWNKDVVWSDGKKAWLYMYQMGGLESSSEERRLGNALSTISITPGYAAILIPELLLPADFGEPHIDTFFKQISLAGEENVSGKDCYVIRLSNPGGMDLKLWVDRSSYLILRAFDKLANATISYQPKRDVKIAESEFEFSPPK